MSNPNPKTEQLIPFEKGCAPGPGRPKKNLITNAARSFLEQPHPKKPELTRAEVIALKWVRRAETGIKDLDPLLERIEGKVPDALPETDFNVEEIARVMGEKKSKKVLENELAGQSEAEDNV